MEASLRVVTARLHSRAWSGTIEVAPGQSTVRVLRPGIAAAAMTTSGFLLVATGRGEGRDADDHQDLNIYSG